MPEYDDQTIGALCTAAGGAVAVIRLSGPRALEAAGLKAPGNEKRLQLRAEKRIRARRRKTQAKLESRSAERQEPVVSGQEPKSNT